MKASMIRDGLLLMCLFGAALGAGLARAADGVIEINQARALAGGVTPSDAPGYPVTLDAPGSYALTSDLTVAGLNTSGITISSGDVTLDLRGFTIRGACPPSGCSLGSGSGIGVDASGAGNQVRNGRILGFADNGVNTGPQSRISGLIAERNGRDGISAIRETDIVDSRATQNARFGISAGPEAKILDCVGDSNGQGGISTSANSIVNNSSTRGNTLGPGVGVGSGIRVGIASLVAGNVSSANQAHGIDLPGRASLVLENIVYGNSSDGIHFAVPGFADGNTTNNNSGFGISSPPSGINSAAYRENMINANGSGTVSGGTNLRRNSCNGLVTCF